MRVPDFRKIVKFKRGFWEKLGKKTMTQHRTHVQVEGRGSEGKTIGKKLAKYTPAYARRKRAGTAAPNQRSRVVDKANLTLTGKMMDSFKFIRSFNTGFIYGITDSQQAEKLRQNQKKRIISSSEDPLPINLQKKVVKAMASEIVNNIEKTLNVGVQRINV
jgi:hypothetical protein|tara:strand:+ start:765 stop:1247 length:483 start_codon:yes stop_codon:yes gene_type:complete